MNLIYSDAPAANYLIRATIVTKAAAELPDELLENASRATDFLKGLANENRLIVLCSLAAGELSVGELNEVVPLSQSALSQHLSALRESGLVLTRRESRTIYYRLNGDNALRIIEVLQSIFCPK